MDSKFLKTFIRTSLYAATLYLLIYLFSRAIIVNELYFKTHYLAAALLLTTGLLMVFLIVCAYVYSVPDPEKERDLMKNIVEKV